MTFACSTLSLPGVTIASDRTAEQKATCLQFHYLRHIKSLDADDEKTYLLFGTSFVRLSWTFASDF